MKIRTIPAFRRWLESKAKELELLDRYGCPDGCDRLEIANEVDEACRIACRFGMGDAVGSVPPVLTPLAALAVVGRLLAWIINKDAADLLSVEQVASKLGVSPRTVWRRASAGEIPAPIQMGGLTKWRADDVQAWMETV